MADTKDVTKQSSINGIPLNTTTKTTLRIRSPKIEILVGGSYTAGGEEHPYGHTALRVTTDSSDIIYDFGRYRNTWGIGDSEGEGILNIWTDFSRYIASENSLGRLTTGYVYPVSDSDAKGSTDYFLAKVSGKKPFKDIGYMKRYKLDQDYHALKLNCTTISIDGAKVAIPNIDKGSQSFVNGKGLGFKEKAAAKISGWPDRVFMPADLADFLSQKGAPEKTNLYGSKK